MKAKSRWISSRMGQGMRKKILWLTVCILIFSARGVSLAFWNKPQKKEAPAKTDAVFDLNRKLQAKVKAELSSRDWKVRLLPVGLIAAAPEIDVLTFNDGKFSSQALSGRQYPVSSFTVTFTDQGVAVWEVFQEKGNGEIAFWKGQLQEESISGVLCIQAQKAQLQDFYFTSDAGPIPVLQKKEEKKKR